MISDQTHRRRARGRTRGCSMIFHRAARPTAWAGLPNRGFYLDLSYLERLLRHLVATGWDIVTMDEAVRRLALPDQGRFVNLSVDDCYADTAELVVPLFRRLGLPVTLYVTTGIPDRTLRLRDAGLETILQRRDRVSDGGERFELQTAKQRRAAYATLSARFEAAGEEAYLRFCARHGADPDALDEQHRISWAALRTWRDDPCVEIGAHTISHRRISALDPDVALAELAGGRARLESALGRPVRHFAFPFGQLADCGPRDFELARRAGYASASTTCKGLAREGADPFSLPRNTVNGAHRNLAFAHAHLSGLSGLATRMLRRG